MKALRTRFATIAAAALLSAIAGIDSTHAQIRLANGVTFSPSGDWVRSESNDGTTFFAKVDYTSRLTGVSCCISSASACYFRREDTGEVQKATKTVGIAEITSDQPFLGMKANPDGSFHTYAIALVANCNVVLNALNTDIYLTPPGGSDSRPQPFQLRVNP